MRSHAAGFIHPGDGALRFEIKMLLPADLHVACEVQRAGPDHGSIAPSQPQRSEVKTFRQDRILVGENRRERFIVNQHFAGATLRRIESLSENPRNGLAVIDGLSWEERFVVPVGSRIALAWNI